MTSSIAGYYRRERAQPPTTLNYQDSSTFQNEPAMFAAAVTLQIIVAAIIASVLQKYITQLKIVDPGTVVIE